MNAGKRFDACKVCSALCRTAASHVVRMHAYSVAQILCALESGLRRQQIITLGGYGSQRHYHQRVRRRRDRLSNLAESGPDILQESRAPRCPEA